MDRPHRPLRPALVAVGLVLLASAALTACGSSSPSAAGSSGAASRSSVSTSPSTAATGSGTAVTGGSASASAIGTISDPSPAGTFGTEPTVVVPPGPPPTRLEEANLITGTGTTAKAGDTVTVQYVGVAYSSHKVFDASWNRGQPFTFTLGVGQVIKGWDEGVVGMKVGGRRELIIPPQLAYGAASPGAGIAPNDTLIFVVDLVSVG
jgi:peptidylprolyl isomerase